MTIIMSTKGKSYSNYPQSSRLKKTSVKEALLYLMIRLIQKAYHRNDELSIQELFLLLIPTITPLLEGTVFREYMNIYNQGVENGYIKENIPRCGNPVIDAVLDAKRDMAVKNGIAFQCDFLYPGQPDIDVFDLSVLLNNALDNALRGANGREPWIRINAKGHERFLTILVTNSYTGEKLHLDADGFPVSTKEGEGHGLGLKLIRRISHRYNGETEFIQREGEIELRILLHEKNSLFSVTAAGSLCPSMQRWPPV